MCESLSRSAKKIAGLAAFLASTNGIVGCTYIIEPPDFSDTNAENETGLVADDLPISFEQMRQELYEALEPEEYPIEFVEGELLITGQGVSHELFEHEQRMSVVKEARQKKRKSEIFPKLRGFEQYGVSQEDFNNYLRTFPWSWRDAANVQEIVLDPHFVPIEYEGAMHGRPEFAHTSIHERTSQIILTSETFKNPKQRHRAYMEMFIFVMPHELAHANSWRSSPDMTARQSVELMYRVWQDTIAPGRAKNGAFSFPEDIVKSKVIDRMTERYAIIMERALNFHAEKVDSWESWQEAFAAWLQVEGGADRLQSIWEAKIVRRYFQFVDQDFKPWVAVKERRLSIERILSEQIYQHSKKAIETCKDQELRNLLELVRQVNEEDEPKEREEFDNNDWQNQVNEVIPKDLNSKEYKTLISGMQLIEGAILAGIVKKRQESLVKVYDRIDKDKIESFLESLKSMAPDRRELVRKVVIDYARIIIMSSPIKVGATKI